MGKGRELAALHDLLEAFLLNSNMPFTRVQVSGVRPFIPC